MNRIQEIINEGALLFDPENQREVFEKIKNNVDRAKYVGKINKLLSSFYFTQSLLEAYGTKGLQAHIPQNAMPEYVRNLEVIVNDLNNVQDSVLDVFNTDVETNPDISYYEAFGIKGESGISVTRLDPGSKIEFSQVDSSKNLIPFIELATGIDIKQSQLNLENTRKFITIFNMHRNKLTREKFAILYQTLIQAGEERAAAGEVVPFNSSGATDIEKAILTLEDAAEQLLADTETYLPEPPALYLIVKRNSATHKLVKQALRVAFPLAGVTNFTYDNIPINLLPVSRVDLPSSTVGYLVYPKGYNFYISAYSDNVKLSENISTLSYHIAIVDKFAVAALLNKQVLKVNFA